MLISPAVDSDQSTMVERHRQLAALDTAFTSCRKGEGGLLIVEGELGAGKTALLKVACERAVREGFSILRARGSEFETAVPYGVVMQLSESGLLGDWTAELSAAPGESSEDLMFHVLHRTLADLAGTRPVLILLDDMHWADGPSLRFLRYLEKRCAPHPILCCVALASTWATRTIGQEQGAFTAPESTLLPVGALSEDGVRQVLSAAVADPDPDPALVRAYYHATGGNPFFLHEVITELRDLKDGQELLEPASVLRAGPRTVAQAVQRWITHAPGQSTGAALDAARALAVLDSASDLSQLAAVAGLHPREAAAAVDLLTGLGLLAPGTPVRFARPVLRNAVYDDLPQTFRYQAHFSAADTLERRGAPLAQVAAHLLHAPPSRDRRVVDILVAAGQAAAQRGDAASAVTLYRRALRETTAAEAPRSLLTRLGEAELDARDPNAISHLSRALELTGDPLGRASLALSLSGALSAAVRHQEALELLRSVHREVEGLDDSLAHRLRSEMRTISRSAPGVGPVAELPAAGTESYGRLGTSPALRGAQRAFAALVRGETAQHVVRLCQESAAKGPLVSEQDGGAQAAWLLAYCLMHCGRVAEAGSIIDDALQESESLGFHQATGDLRALRAFLHLRCGMLSEVTIDATAVLGDQRSDDAVTVARSYALCALVEACLLRDQPGAAAQALARHGSFRTIPDQALYLPLLVARGRLRIAQNEREAGLRDLMRTEELLERWGARCPAMSPRGVIVTTLVALGRGDEARRISTRHLASARAFGAQAVTAVALHAHASTLDGPAQIAHLEEAVDLLQGSSAPSEQCKALFHLGTALRRAGRLTQARRRLRAAAEGAEAAGFSALAKQARSELAAMGVRVPPSRAGAPQLTPRERRICILAAAGKRNQEIARILFVTVKTVEWHLSQVYRKLGIASRDDLREALARC